jgi:hypothetical protein
LELSAQPIQIGEHESVVDAIEQKFATKCLSRFERNHVTVETMPAPLFRQGSMRIALNREEPTLGSYSLCHNRRREKSGSLDIEWPLGRGVE